MNLIEAIILGIIEGVTEFLPISSTGHLTIAEKLFGLPIDDKGITAFTAIIQTGAILAVLLYFRKDILRILAAWLRGLVDSRARSNKDYKFGWGIIIGSVPIAIIGLLFSEQIETNLRSMWIVAIALIGWSGVMYLADRLARQNRHETDVTWKDTLFIGVAQCIALFPGVSRSGATISGGLLRGLDRVTVTRLSFFLSIPALLAAGIYQATSSAAHISSSVGWTATIVATVVSFFVAYASIAWLLRYVANHNFTAFILYRIGLGLLIIVLLATDTISAT